MKFALDTRYAKPLAIYLIVALLSLSTFAGPAEAMFVPLQQGTAAPGTAVDRTADLARIQAALESKIIRQKLIDYGLSPEEAMAKVGELSAEQIHELAVRTDAIQAGGDPADAFFTVVLIALLIVVLVYLLQHRIEVR